MREERLIFIISSPRSGSTLLQALLSNNNKVATVSEPWLLLPFLSHDDSSMYKARYNSMFAATGIKEFKLKVGEVEFNQSLSQFLVDQYARLLTKQQEYVIDKTPRYYEILESITAYFPNSKIILLRRNPFAVLGSIIETWHKDSTDKLLQFHRDILFAPKHLAQFVVKNKTNPNIREVHYEALVQNPSKVVQELFDWIGLDVEINLDYSTNKKIEGKMGDPKGVYQYSKPSTDSLNRWSTIASSKKWRSFFRGYAHYLGREFLEEYDVDRFINPKKTRLFSAYEKRAKELNYF